MNDDLKALVVAVNDMRSEGTGRITVRSVGARIGTHYSTVQDHIERACAEGYLQREPHRYNTLRLAPGIVVHNGDIYQMLPVG